MADMTATDARQMGRAKNAVLSFLEKKLSVPKIYIDADWDGARVDVLAIDRDGVGDVNVVLLYMRPSGGLLAENHAEELGRIDTLIDRLKSIPAQYKYIAAIDFPLEGVIPPFGLSHELNEKSFAQDGLGRVGFLIVTPSSGELRVEVAFRAERFRAFIAKLADEYIQRHPADWEMRP
jgi:hypothetical protein